MLRFTVAALALGTCLALPLPSTAAVISNIAIDNNSSPDTALVTSNGERLREFRSAGTAPSSAATTTDSVSFDTRFAWMAAQRILPGGEQVLPSFANRVAYDLGFRVEDPLGLGYTLSFDALFRGFLTALWEGSAAPLSAGVFAAGTLMSATLDAGAGFGSLIAPLTTTLEIATADDSTRFVNQLVSETARYEAGRFSGTRDFTLRFAALANNAIASMQNFNRGESNVRFGLDPTLSGFVNAAYPGAEGEGADRHGHFLTVTARFDRGPPDGGQVPEPGTLALLGLGLLAAGAVRRARR
ncbi:MAG: PEP-CTERM sorting domain-containing protein [Burkholderiaceae bacterium]|nr:PEP-CTERM sorting domain-containing protein [Burkholderiaceae bacterium]